MALTAPLRMQYKPVTRVENACATASDAFRNACYAVAAGVYDIVLALGVEKLKDSGFSGLGMSGGSATTNIQPTTTAPGMFAMLATTYFARYGLSGEEGKKMLAHIPVRSHHNGALNPKAHFQREITLDIALNAPIVAWPLGLFDCCGVSDGSAAAIICRADLARQFTDQYVLVRGFGLATGPGLGKEDPRFGFDCLPESEVAVKLTYEAAGITDPLKEVSAVNCHDCFTIAEAMEYEAQGYIPKGKAKEYLEQGFFSIDGEMPFNTDGGLKCFGHPIGASGIRMSYEIYNQLLGRAGPRQVKIKGNGIGISEPRGGIPGWLMPLFTVLALP